MDWIGKLPEERVKNGLVMQGKRPKRRCQFSLSGAMCPWELQRSGSIGYWSRQQLEVKCINPAQTQFIIDWVENVNPNVNKPVYRTNTNG